MFLNAYVWSLEKNGTDESISKAERDADTRNGHVDTGGKRRVGRIGD